MHSDDDQCAERATHKVANEAWRIERKLSRYRADSDISHINNAQGEVVQVDDELANLLDFCDQGYKMSGGLFDITSGVLRRVWRFDGSDRVPQAQEVQTLLPLIGWHKIVWDKPSIEVPIGMQIDLGGIGKEYAVDCAARLITQEGAQGTLINFGGDIYAAGDAPAGGWHVGIEMDDAIVNSMRLPQGGLATSGDARRFLLKDGVRYSHILNPKNGWPVRNAPRSVTVAADTCLEAGFIASLALLHGKNARSFLRAQKVQFWIA